MSHRKRIAPNITLTHKGVTLRGYRLKEEVVTPVYGRDGKPLMVRHTLTFEPRK